MSTTMAEPEWDADTRDLVLAMEDVELCSVCGRLMSICQDPERQFDWEVGVPSRCHATTALRETQKAFTEESNPILEALVWPVHLRNRRGQDRSSVT